MGRIEGEIQISRPVGEVFDVVADSRNEPRYNPQMLSAEKLSDGPVRLGTQFRAVMKTRRGTTALLIELTEYARPTRLGSASQLAAMTSSGRLTLAPVDGGTRLHWSWEVRPRGPARLLSPLITWVGRRQEQRIWAGLKALLEAEPPG